MRVHRTGLGSAAAAPITAVAVAALVVIGLAGCSAARHPTTRYGGLPAYLPKSSVTPDRELVGTAARPALTTEGDSVKVITASGATVTAVMVGPVVPGEGLPFQGAATTATWTITLSGASTTVPVTMSQFNVIDHLGTIYHPMLVTGETPPPSTLAPGQTVTFQLQAVMNTGEGLLQWAPEGTTVLAEWDFVVEND